MEIIINSIFLHFYRCYDCQIRSKTYLQQLRFHGCCLPLSMYWKKGPSREGKADIKYGDPFEWDDLFVEARVYDLR